ncbi:MAG: hypothetical protein VCC36_00860, partial [Gammaproteobacteria bacterium]
LVALALDLTLRRDAKNSASLDTVMAELWRQFGMAGVGVEEVEFEALVEELSGCKLQEFSMSLFAGPRIYRWPSCWRVSVSVWAFVRRPDPTTSVVRGVVRPTNAH